MNQRLMSAMVRMINSLNSGLTKTLLEPLGDGHSHLVRQVATACKFDLESVVREGNSPLQLSPALTIEYLWSKINESINRLQQVHKTILSVPTLLRIIQQFNSSNGLQSRDMIFTVDDLKKKLGFHSANGGGIKRSVQ